jgi:HlyD family secretion protein
MKVLLQYTILCYICFSCSNNKEFIHPSREDITESIYASGIIKSENQHQLYTNSSGIIDKILVKEGQFVKQGTPLLLLFAETSTLNRKNAQLASDMTESYFNEGKMQELELAVQVAERKYINDSLDLQRNTKLAKTNLIAQTQLEQSQLAFINSKANFKSALIRKTDFIKTLNINKQQANNNLSVSKEIENNFTIYADRDGCVFNFLKKEGEFLSPQVPALVFGNPKQYLIELQIDEYDITSIQIGQEIIVNLDSHKGKTFKAVIERIYPFMNERSKTFTVDARFIQEPEILYPNLTLEANIIVQVKKNALTIPISYLLPEDSILLQGGRKVKVKTGISDMQKIEILDGLKLSDELILNQ